MLFTVPFTAVPTGATGRTVLLDFSFSLTNSTVNYEFGKVQASLGAIGSAAGTLAAPYATLIGSALINEDTSTAKTLTVNVQHGTASGAIAYTAKTTVLEFT